MFTFSNEPRISLRFTDTGFLATLVLWDHQKLNRVELRTELSQEPKEMTKFIVKIHLQIMRVH